MKANALELENGFQGEEDIDLYKTHPIFKFQLLVFSGGVEVFDDDCSFSSSTPRDHRFRGALHLQGWNYFTTTLTPTECQYFLSSLQGGRLQSQRPGGQAKRLPERQNCSPSLDWFGLQLHMVNSHLEALREVVKSHRRAKMFRCSFLAFRKGVEMLNPSESKSIFMGVVLKICFFFLVVFFGE